MALHHIGFVTADINRAFRQFADEGARKVTEPVHDPIQDVHVQFLALAAGCLIELVAPASDSSPVRVRLARGGGLDHLCFTVTDLKQAVQEARAAGAMVPYGPYTPSRLPDRLRDAALRTKEAGCPPGADRAGGERSELQRGAALPQAGSGRIH